LELERGSRAPRVIKFGQGDLSQEAQWQAISEPVGLNRTFSGLRSWSPLFLPVAYMIPKGLLLHN
jgi:hypothetical protein